MFMQRHRVMAKWGKVAADPDLIVVSLPRRSGCASILVIEPDLVVHVIADRLNTRPSALNAAKEMPGGVRELVGFAVPAPEQIDDHIVGQFLDRLLHGRRNGWIMQAGITDQEIR